MKILILKNKIQWYIDAWVFILIENENYCITEGENQFKCDLPFSYEGNTYYNCTKAGGYDKPWCYHNHENQVSKWDYCMNCITVGRGIIYIYVK